eukprot:gene3933-4299_t
MAAVSGEAFGLVLGAAVLHASWNLLARAMGGNQGNGTAFGIYKAGIDKIDSATLAACPSLGVLWWSEMIPNAGGFLALGLTGAFVLPPTWAAAACVAGGGCLHALYLVYAPRAAEPIIPCPRLTCVQPGQPATRSARRCQAPYDQSVVGGTHGLPKANWIGPGLAHGSCCATDGPRGPATLLALWHLRQHRPSQAILWVAYSKGEMSIVYPVARGTGVVIAFTASHFVLDESWSLPSSHLRVGYLLAGSVCCIPCVLATAMHSIAVCRRVSGTIGEVPKTLPRASGSSLPQA